MQEKQRAGNLKDKKNALKAKGEYRALGGRVIISPETCGNYPKHCMKHCMKSL